MAGGLFVGSRKVRSVKYDLMFSAICSFRLDSRGARVTCQDFFSWLPMKSSITLVLSGSSGSLDPDVDSGTFSTPCLPLVYGKSVKRSTPSLHPLPFGI